MGGIVRPSVGVGTEVVYSGIERSGRVIAGSWSGAVSAAAALDAEPAFSPETASPDRHYCVFYFKRLYVVTLRSPCAVTLMARTRASSSTDQQPEAPAAAPARGRGRGRARGRGRGRAQPLAAAPVVEPHIDVEEVPAPVAPVVAPVQPAVPVPPVAPVQPAAPIPAVLPAQPNTVAQPVIAGQTSEGAAMTADSLWRLDRFSRLFTQTFSGLPTEDA
uniref:Oleosin-B6-like n=1 Tax=Nicotiana tabacum TaxID=4097 RepID=A0A1S4D3D5_TOBAC|nr:PREDICTED: oleosin-B6-like [Nicotiana tabacum]